MKTAPAWILLGVLLLAACTDHPAPAPAESASRPRQAGQPLDPLATAARMAAIRGAAARGDQQAVRQQMDAMSDDVRRTMRMPDPARRIPAEAAREQARTVAGVSSVAWVDATNLLVMVDGAQFRDYATIDRICMALEPLGDTLWVNIHLQNRRADTGDALEILSRNCQLPPGQRAFMQQQRRLDVVDPAIRAQQRAVQVRMRDAQARKAADDRANAEALRNIPEM
ncbi:hypothetical protein [Thermomonas sp.]|uniref:hypothetical protein n=1 Tax=Thermomonas sp. TaxID=1971895 RepID=UPI0035B40526